MTVAAYLAAARSAGGLLRSPRLIDRWDAPSALPELPISGLAGHLARSVLNVERYLAADVPAGIEPFDAPSYFFQTGDADTTDIAAPINRAVRERGMQDATDGPTALADRYDECLARLADRLPRLPAELPVLMFGKYVLPLSECLCTRVVELVVHADDLAVSLDLPTPEFTDGAARLAVTTLADIALRRHGTTAVVRTLARRERATGPIAAF